MSAGVLRPAGESDVETMRRWRNHPQVRAVSLTTHEIGADEHQRWWQAVRADSDRLVLVFDYDGTPAGVVNFAGIQSPARELSWGYYLDIDGLTSRGQLLPAWISLERGAIDYAFRELDATILGGETLESNRPVLDLHRRFGFRVVHRYQRDVNAAPAQVVWSQLARSDYDIDH